VILSALQDEPLPLRIAHAHCLQVEGSGMVLMSHICEASKVTVNGSYFHPANQHYTDEAHKAEMVPSVVRYRSMAFRVILSALQDQPLPSRIAHARCLQVECSGIVLMSHICEASKVTVNSSYFHPAHQHYTDEEHKAETVPSLVRYRSMAFRSY
jgi:recombinational DNA repair protein (RecF pathway)